MVNIITGGNEHDEKIKTNDLQNARKAKRVATFQLDTMVLSGVLLLLVFNYLPMIGLVIAFKDYNPNLGIWAASGAGWITSSSFSPRRMR